MLKSILLSVCCIAVSTSVALSYESNAERAAKELAKYEQTGEFKQCINNNYIKRTKVLDDTRILFEMNNDKFYLNTMDHKCPHLGFNKSFSYKVRVGKVCNNDMINVVEIAELGPTCVLNKFEVLEERTETDS